MRRPVVSVRVAMRVATSAAPRVTTSAAMWPGVGEEGEGAGREAGRELDAEEGRDEAEGAASRHRCAPGVDRGGALGRPVRVPVAHRWRSPSWRACSRVTSRSRRTWASESR